MPACTGEKCICGWFWLANNGTASKSLFKWRGAASGPPSAIQSC